MTTPDVGTTIRYPSTSLFTIDSEDRWTGYAQAYAASDPYVEVGSGVLAFQDPFNFQLQNRGLLSTGFFTRLAVSEVVMPWCPNINPKTNQINVQYHVGGVLQTINLTLSGRPGQWYTPAEIAKLFQARLRAADPTNLADFEISYGTGNQPQFFYQLNGSVATDIAFFPMIAGSAIYPYSDTTKQLFQVMG